MRLLALATALLALTSVRAQDSHPAPPPQDRDVNDLTFDAHDITSGKQAPLPAPAPEHAAEAASGAEPTSPDSGASLVTTGAPASVPRAVPASNESADRVLATEALPLPHADALHQTQLSGSLSFSWRQVPLDETVRVLARYLPKPVHLAVSRTVAVTGDFKELPATAILRQIADRNQLQLDESGFAYILQDQGRPLKLQTAKVVFPEQHGLPTASPIGPEPLVIPVPADRDQKAAEKRFADAHAKAAQKRQELSRPLDK